jgi:MoaA/NifB/PqqE/SkfB family radical SAM enzyme
MNCPLPLNYIIDVNHDCNFKCKMCIKRQMKKPFGQRPFEDLKTLAEKLPWARNIAIGALGDPFCYKDLEKSLNYFMNSKIDSSLTTNASLITDENMKLIPQNSTLHISVDEGHEECQNVIENIMKLKAKRTDLNININHLLMRNSLDRTEELINLCHIINANIILFYPMYFTKHLEEELSVFRMEDFEDRMARIINMCNNLQVRCMTSPVKMQQRPCFRAFSNPIIAYDGTVYPCDYVYQSIENTKDGTWKSWHLGEGYDVPQYEYNMGNLYEESFIDMWRSDKWEDLRRKIFKLNAMPLDKFEAKEDTEEFDHCKRCLARWGRCL